MKVHMYERERERAQILLGERVKLVGEVLSNLTTMLIRSFHHGILIISDLIVGSVWGTQVSISPSHPSPSLNPPPPFLSYTVLNSIHVTNLNLLC